MLTKRQKQNTIKEVGRHEKDTGSAEVQIGLITKQISTLAEHLKTHKKDNHSRRGLLMMVGKRRRFLRYLKQENEEQYQKIAKKLELSA